MPLKDKLKAYTLYWLHSDTTDLKCVVTKSYKKKKTSTKIMIYLFMKIYFYYNLLYIKNIYIYP